MSKRFRWSTAILFCLFFSCSGAENYPEAYAYQEDGKAFIKIKGKRVLMVHDLGALFSNHTYEDSPILQVPSLQNGTVSGEQIPVPQGYYTYRGQLIIDAKRVKVNLSYDHRTDKTEEPLSWNGEYVLLRN